MSVKAKRGQISFEYLAIVTFGLMVLLVAIYVFYGYSLNSNDTFVVSQVEDIGNQIVDTSELLYYATGKGSSVNLQINFPTNVKEIYFINGMSDSELVIKYNLRRGSTESVFFTPVVLNGSYNWGSGKSSIFAQDDFHSGALKLKIISIDGGVILEEAT